MLDAFLGIKEPAIKALYKLVSTRAINPLSPPPAKIILVALGSSKLLPSKTVTLPLMEACVSANVIAPKPRAAVFVSKSAIAAPATTNAAELLLTPWRLATK